MKIELSNKKVIFYIVVLILSLSANIYWGYYYQPFNVNIPSREAITHFCQSKDYDNGWLSSSSCGTNEVQCHKKIFDLDKYECVKWQS